MTRRTTARTVNTHWKSPYRIATSFLAMVLFATLSVGLHAGTITWDDGDAANSYWNSVANWDGGVVPASGDLVNLNGGAGTADINGATIDMGAGEVRFYNGNGGSFVLTDSAGGGFVKASVIHVQQGGRPAYEIRVPITATTEVRTRYRLGSVKFYKQIDTPEMDLGRGDSVFLYGDVNATTIFKVVKDDSSTNAYLVADGASPVPTLTTPLIHIEDSSSKFEASGFVVADDINITSGGRYIVKHASGLGDSTTNVLVDNGGYLQIDTPQTSLASIDVAPFSVLAGDLTGATFGAGGAISLAEDAVLAPAAGSPVPTRADLGGDAILYQGLTTTNKTVTVGDNGTDAIYKGAAVGAFYGNNSMSGVSVTAQTGSGDLQVVYAGANCPTIDSNNKFYGDGTSTTADFLVLNGALIRLRQAFNSDYDYSNTEPTRIDTFNISGEVGKERALILDHYRTSATHLKDGQTWNISDGKWNPGTYFAGKGQHGDVTLTNGIMQEPGTAYDATADSGFTLTLAGRTVIEATDPTKHANYEALGANFSYSGLPVIGLTNGKAYAIDYDTSAAGANPVMADLMLNSDISNVSYSTIDFADDFKIGHEKYFYNSLNRNSGGLKPSAISTAKVLPGGNQPVGETAVIGFAAFGTPNVINLEVDATGAIVRVGTNDPNRLMTAESGGFVNSIPDQTVFFQQNVTASGVEVQSGTARFAQDVSFETLDIGLDSKLQMDSGKTATVSDTLSGAGSWTGGNGITLAAAATVSPGGDRIGTLSGGTLELESGSTYFWQMNDPDGVAGTDWDLLFGSDLNLDPDDDDIGVFNLEVTDLYLGRDIDPAERFLIAESTGDFNLPTTWDYNVTAVPGIMANWDVSNAELVFDGNLLYLTNVSVRLPEPSSILLAVMGLLGLAGFARRRRRKA